MNDWSSRIKDLERLGWSLKAIGETIGLSTSSVSDIKRGATLEPRGMSAVRLHDLHASGRGPQDFGLEPDAVHRQPAAENAGDAAQAAEDPVLRVA